MKKNGKSGKKGKKPNPHLGHTTTGAAPPAAARPLSAIPCATPALYE
jgi:hypothetical protein